MSTLQETIHSYYITLTEDSSLVELLYKYKTHLLNVLVALAAFYFGKWRARSNQFERYINSFINSTKTEAELIAKHQFYSKIRRYERYTFYAVFGLLVAVPVYVNWGLFTDPALQLKERLGLAKSSAANGLISFAALTFMVMSYLAGRYLQYTLANISARLDSIKTNKSLYVEKFFDLIGPEMMREIRKFLVKSSEKEESKHRELELRYNEVQQKMRGMQEMCLLEHRRFEAYKLFADDIMRFEWCENCYAVDCKRAYRADNPGLKHEEDPKMLVENSGVGQVDTPANQKAGAKDQGNDRGGSEKTKQAPGNASGQEVEETKSKFGIEQATNMQTDNEFKDIDEVLSRLSKSHQDTRTDNRCTLHCLERFLGLCEDLGNRLAENLKRIESK